MSTESVSQRYEQTQHERFVHRVPAMGTMAEITVSGLPPNTTRRCTDLLEDLESRWSRFRPDSEISGLNRAAKQAMPLATTTAPIVVSDETFHLLAMAIEAWRQTEGAFDPTIGATMEAAGYDRSFEQLAAPDPIAINQPHSGTNRSRGALGPEKIVLDELVNTVRLPPGTVIDLGGIGKGAAADRLAQTLMHAGATGCCVNIGGDLRIMGTPPRPEGWQVRLDCPGAAHVVRVGIEAGAVCTTSKSKRRWASPLQARSEEHHLRNPATGAPLETGVTSVTVIAARATQAEVLCKAAFAAGLEAGPQLVAERGATGLMVGDDGTVVPMPGLSRYQAAALLQAGAE